MERCSGAYASAKRTAIAHRTGNQHAGDVAVEGGADNVLALAPAGLLLDGRSHGVGLGLVVGHRDGGGGLVVFGLGDQVRRDEGRSAVLSATTSISEGPARKSMATSPRTSALAAVTHRLPGPTTLSTAVTVSVP